MRVYHAYVDMSAYSRVIIDATGNVAPKIKRPNGLSGHIFLYNIVISLPGEHEGQVPINQMLSERQNATAIGFWLRDG